MSELAKFGTARRRSTAISLRFVLVCAIGIGIFLGCLWVSLYALGLRSALADNLAANVVRLGLARAFRFWADRTPVFTERRDAVHGTEHGAGVRRSAELSADPATSGAHPQDLADHVETELDRPEEVSGDR